MMLILSYNPRAPAQSWFPSEGRTVTVRRDVHVASARLLTGRRALSQARISNLFNACLSLNL